MTKQTEQDLRKLLRQTLSQNPRLRRKELLERCVDQLDLTQDQRQDQRLDSLTVQLKSRLGTLLTRMIHAGDIEESESGFLTLATDGAALARDRAEEYIFNVLSDGKPWPKYQIYREADRRLQPPTKEVESEVHSLLGQTLQRLLREGRIRESAKGYLLPMSQYPRTELGYWLQEAQNGADLCQCFLQAIHTQGGEWFEAYAVGLLSDYYRRTGKTVDASYVTGGSNDGGLDGVIETTDWMGFRENILMQMKNRNSMISPKDIREFYGAVCIAQGSRGIFVTISSFHNEAQKLLEQVDNLIGVDGKKLFEIAQFCGYGLVEREGKWTIDANIFLEERR